MSGQEVSQEKTSILFSKNVSKGMQAKLLNLSKFRQTKNFGKYLGVPLSGKRLKKEDFQYVVDQVATKLSSWKKNHLTLAGRLTLAKSVIEAIPIYPMMTSKLPKKSIDDIHALQRKFVWGDTDDRKRIHAVAWDTITKPKQYGGTGLRNLDTLNDVCLMKLGWKVYNNSNDLWCTVLKGKYNVTTGKDCLNLRTQDSSLWKDISNSISLMLTTGQWIIGDGKDIRAWEDNWLGHEYVVSNMEVQIPTDLRGAKVCDLVNERGEWNLNILTQWLPEQWISKLKACAPPCSGHYTDLFCFAGTGDGKFSIKSMYKDLDGHNVDWEDGDWMKIWKAGVPERCKSFVWLLKHDRILTNFSKSRKGIGSASCKLCGNTCESTIHAMRDCPKCSHLWSSLVPSEISGEFFTADLKDWIHINLNYSGTGNEEWRNVWIITCHQLWAWRNLEEHDEHFERPGDPICHILRNYKEFKQAIEASKKISVVKNDSKFLGWLPPVGGMMKLNTDGARKNNSEAGCGGIIRDQRGVWKGGFSKYLGKCSVELAELWGVLEGLKLTKSLNIQRVELNVDSAIVVKAIEERKIGIIDCVNVLRQIKDIICEHELVIVVKVSRFTNGCADMLATQGCIDKNFILYKEVPDFIEPFVVADSLGISSFFLDKL